MPSEARRKKIKEKLKEGLKTSILGPQNLGSGGAPPGSASAVNSIELYIKLNITACLTVRGF